MDKWISVDDEMPEEEGMYLCFFSDGSIETYEVDSVYGMAYEFTPVNLDILGKVEVTHWMPLPDAPI